MLTSDLWNNKIFLMLKLIAECSRISYASPNNRKSSFCLVACLGPIFMQDQEFPEQETMELKGIYADMRSSPCPLYGKYFYSVLPRILLINVELCLEL